MQMGRFVTSFQFLQHTMRISVQNGPFGGLSMGNMRSHPSEQKILSEELYGTIRTATIPSNLIWKVYGKFIHLSGPTFPIPTSSYLLGRTSSISYIKVFSRTILSNGAPALSEKKLLMHSSTL